MLVVCLSRARVVLAADRRVSYTNRSRPVDIANKIVMFNQQALIGFTGIASVDGQSTVSWIAKQARGLVTLNDLMAALERGANEIGPRLLRFGRHGSLTLAVCYFAKPPGGSYTPCASVLTNSMNGVVSPDFRGYCKAHMKRDLVGVITLGHRLTADPSSRKRPEVALARGLRNSLRWRSPLGQSTGAGAAGATISAAIRRVAALSTGVGGDVMVASLLNPNFWHSSNQQSEFRYYPADARDARQFSPILCGAGNETQFAYATGDWTSRSSELNPPKDLR